MDEPEVVEAYQVWECVCPECGEVLRIGNDLTGDAEECYSCYAEFEVTT